LVPACTGKGRTGWSSGFIGLRKLISERRRRYSLGAPRNTFEGEKD